MQRFNLWLKIQDHSKVICWGEQDEMNDIAHYAGVQDEGDVYVLPDGEEPH